MTDHVRDALIGEYQKAAQATSDAAYAVDMEVERQRRRVDGLSDLRAAAIRARERETAARRALERLGYAVPRPDVAVGVSPENLSNEDLGL